MCWVLAVLPELMVAEGADDVGDGVGRRAAFLTAPFRLRFRVVFFTAPELRAVENGASSARIPDSLCGRCGDAAGSRPAHKAKAEKTHHRMWCLPGLSTSLHLGHWPSSMPWPRSLPEPRTSGAAR